MPEPPAPPALSGQPWLMDPALQRLLAALGPQNARIVGGAVRNALLGEPVQDIDIATTLPPEEAMRRARKAGFSVHPVGIEHGSILAADRGRTFEITTLRRDLRTDGRHAEVAFIDDWHADARRRDFTMNALYADTRGRIFDPLGGYRDLRRRTLRFIGDPAQRMEEDYLRILRFFRFFAQYAEGPPDEAALEAIRRLAPGLERISRERIGAELRRLLPARRAVEAVLLMDETGVLDHVLPPSCRRDHAALARMILADERLGLKPDWLLRLAAFCAPEETGTEALKAALRLSRHEAKRLHALQDALEALTATQEHPASADALRILAYRHGTRMMQDALRLAHARGSLSEEALRAALEALQAAPPPRFPLTGSDALAAGIEPGRKLGQILKRVEEQWIAGGFSPQERSALLAMLKEEARRR